MHCSVRYIVLSAVGLAGLGRLGLNRLESRNSTRQLSYVVSDTYPLARSMPLC